MFHALPLPGGRERSILAPRGPSPEAYYVSGPQPGSGEGRRASNGVWNTQSGSVHVCGISEQPHRPLQLVQREVGRGREKERSMRRNMDQLLPAHALLGMEPATRACALTGNRTVTSWFIGRCSTTEPHWLGCSPFLDGTQKVEIDSRFGMTIIAMSCGLRRESQSLNKPCAEGKTQPTKMTTQDRN